MALRIQLSTRTLLSSTAPAWTFPVCRRWSSTETTSAAPDAPPAHPSFLAATNTVADLSAGDLGRIYQLRDPRAVFAEAGAFADHRNASHRSLGVQQVLYRPAMRAVTDALAEWAARPTATAGGDATATVGAAGAGSAFGVYVGGHRGTGKSVVLNHALHWARRQGWLVLGFPSVFQWLNGPGIVRPIDTDAALYDLPDLNLSLVRGLRSPVHLELLGRLPLQFPEHADLRRRRDARIATVADLVEYGARNRDSACEVFPMVFRELRHAEAVPVLLVVDEFNLLFAKTPYMDTSAQPLFGQNIQALRTVFDVVKNGGVRLASVVAETHRYPSPTSPKQHAMVPFMNRVIVPGFSEVEMRTLFDFAQQEANWVSKPLSDLDIRRLHTISGGCGYAVSRYLGVH